MKTKKTFLLPAVLSVQLCCAQFAKIVDKDGYVNVREKAGMNSKVIGKINSGEIVYAVEPNETNKNWINTYCNDKISGYIDRSRLKLIESYEKIPLVTKNETQIIFKSENINVAVISEKFNYKKNKKFFSSSNYNGIKVEDKYKGQRIWGTDGNIPATHYQSISGKMGDITFQIPNREIENLFNPNNEFTECYFDRKNDTLYITMLNSDGAGGYVALIKIVKGKYKEKTVAMPF